MTASVSRIGRAVAGDRLAEAIGTLVAAAADEVAARVAADDGTALSVAQVAGRLGCSRDHVYDLIHRSGLPAFLDGSRTKVNQADLVGWQRSQRLTPRGTRR